MGILYRFVLPVLGLLLGCNGGEVLLGQMSLGREDASQIDKNKNDTAHSPCAFCFPETGTPEVVIDEDSTNDRINSDSSVPICSSSGVALVEPFDGGADGGIADGGGSNRLSDCVEEPNTNDSSMSPPYISSNGPIE